MRKLASLTLLPLFLGAAALAFAGAQTSSTPQQASSISTRRTPSAMPPTQSGQISDATLRKFVNALRVAQPVHKEYLQKIQGTSDPQRKAQLRQQEKKQVAQAISQYMTPTEFMQVQTQVRHDPALKARVKNYIKEHRDQTSPPSSGSGPAPGQISDATLRKFVNALRVAQPVHKEYLQKIQGTSDPQRKAQLRQQEKKQVAQAISQYMTPTEFMQVQTQVRHDPALKARVKNYIKEHRQQTQPASAGSSQEK